MGTGTGNFCDFIRERRMQLGMTLRDFCLKNSFDPGNVSKLERGVMPAPHSAAKLAEYATALRIKRGTKPWTTFMDLAAASQGRIPRDLMKDEHVISRLPAFFRTLRNKKLTGQKLDELIDRLRGS